MRGWNICGIKASPNGLAVTHVMYADDIVLFSKASPREAHNIVNVLDKYCIWSGQCLNNKKSGIIFSKHTSNQHCRAIKDILQVKELKKDSVYLGAPPIPL